MVFSYPSQSNKKYGLHPADKSDNYFYVEAWEKCRENWLKLLPQFITSMLGSAGVIEGQRQVDLFGSLSCYTEKLLSWENTNKKQKLLHRCWMPWEEFLNNVWGQENTCPRADVAYRKNSKIIPKDYSATYSAGSQAGERKPAY